MANQHGNDNAAACAACYDVGACSWEDLCSFCVEEPEQLVHLYSEADASQYLRMRAAQ